MPKTKKKSKTPASKPAKTKSVSKPKKQSSEMKSSKGVSFGSKTYAPAASGWTIRSVPPKIMRNVTHKEEGFGILVSGTEHVGRIALQAGAFSAFAPDAGAIPFIRVNPVYMNGGITSSRLYSLAFPWSKFRYQKLKVYCTSKNSTAAIPAAGGVDIAMGYWKDPAAAFHTDWDSYGLDIVMEAQPAVDFAYWKDGELDIDSKSMGSPDGICYYIDPNNTTSDESVRQAYQGTVVFTESNDNSPDGYATHEVWVEYEVAFYGPRPTDDLALLAGCPLVPRFFLSGDIGQKHLAKVQQSRRKSLLQRIMKEHPQETLDWFKGMIKECLSHQDSVEDSPEVISSPAKTEKKEAPKSWGPFGK
jgi:hypothetical protein